MKAINFTQKELDQLHNILFEMMCEVDRICRKYDIKYIICGGTLLGAIRHKGFIPWDDDVDIRMERNEYNRFCEVCQKELDSDKYFFQTYKTDKEYPWFYGKLRYNYSQFTRGGQEHLKMNDGIFIDIFVSDGIPNTKSKRMKFLKYCFVLKKFLYSCVGCKSEKNPIKKMMYFLMNKVPKKYIHNIMHHNAVRFNKKKYKYVADYSFSNCSQNDVVPRVWLLDVVDVEFNGHKFMAPRMWDKWLKLCYGDYMKLPPLDKRKGNANVTVYRVTDENIQK